VRDLYGRWANIGGIVRELRRVKLRRVEIEMHGKRSAME